ncbi:hypothetical protein [Spongiactinospora sp. TRM90649]|uniref:hypothetical protein n=1 Tax=Spongiactinospora sp. TRM90649 TaxID=3031114 RepID=UPI0023F6DD22|nr:hypothetical protein [Spongiactinospora sp. TRM90649]MDF5754133.1 hypothetical protein [Spongiactinospora sp. TRM90649]
MTEESGGGKPGPARRRRPVYRSAARDQEWLLAVLPAFPVALLVMRLWYAGRQDTQTVLLLVQHVSPLGLLSVVLLTMIWVVPVVVLAGRVLGSLYRVSTGRSSWLVRSADRIPDWVVALAVLLAMLGWQLRFLPVLAAFALSAAGLTVRDRHPERARLVYAVCVVVPVLAAVFVYVILYPAIAMARAEGDFSTLILLAVPPGVAPLLTGPVPEVSAWLIAHGAAAVLAVVLPLATGLVVLRAPILPLSAVEVTPERKSPGNEVVVGYVIAADDRMTTLLERAGPVRFVRNDMLVSRVLCPEPGDVPRSRVHLRHWYVEQSMISWLAPDPLPAAMDPRCEGRPPADP